MSPVANKKVPVLPSEKWISDLTVETPVADAARRVLAVRLAALHLCLDRALRSQDQPVEHVHQLRVAARRAMAGLEIFADCLPSKAFALVRDQVRAIRRAAGNARDWDVFVERMKELAKSLEDRSGLDMLIGYALAHRIPAQQQLEEVCPEYPFDFERLTARTLGAVRCTKHGDEKFGDLAQRMLERLVKRFELAASGDLQDCESLHELRILGKRMRYAIELFADCFDSSLRKRVYPAVAEMQEILGDVNDNYVGIGIQRKLASHLQRVRLGDDSRYESLVRRLLLQHEEQLTAARARFQVWWREWRDPAMRLLLTDLASSQKGKAGASIAVCDGTSRDQAVFPSAAG